MHINNLRLSFSFVDIYSMQLNFLTHHRGISLPRVSPDPAGNAGAVGLSVVAKVHANITFHQH